MRTIIAILLLGFSVRAQITAPQLRCVRVQDTNIILTWIPPSDPNNQFFSYKIYHSDVGITHYTAVPNPPTVISANSYTHVGTSSGKYYMRVMYGPGGKDSTATSDTLSSIFLNLIINAGQPNLDLNWNDMHRPRLQTASASYTVMKEYPANVWSTFLITPLNKASDTINFCRGGLMYEVRLSDNSGCTSVSNRQGGNLFTDQKIPNSPYIDSISVMPDGSIAVSWRPPYDKDVVQYEIQMGTNSTGGSPIDTVKGRLTGFYIYHFAAATNSVVNLGPKAIDSCGNGSLVDYSAATMLCKFKYDRCAYTTTLNWSPYTLRASEVMEYRVMYSVNGGPYKVIGTTTTTSFVHSGVDAGQSLSYYIRMVSKVNSVTSSSNRVGFMATQVPAAGYIYIIESSVVNSSQVHLQVLMDISRVSVGFDVYRSHDSINYSYVGRVGFQKGQAIYGFDDIGVSAQSQRYFYKAIVSDSCGNPRSYSNISGTILLKAADDEKDLFVKHLSWNPPTGYLAGVSGYNIYRIVNRQYNVQPIAKIGFQQTTYDDNLESAQSEGSSVLYIVQAVESLGNPYGVRGYSSSNERPVYVESELFVPNAFVPAGVNSIWKPVSLFIDVYNYQVMIFDRWGHKIFESFNVSEGWDGGDFPSGVYAYVINYRTAMGEYRQKQGTVMLVR